MLKNLLKRLLRNRKGAAFVEYALLVGGIALVGAAAIATFGHKTTDLLGAMTAILPGAHADDNAPITSGKLIETAPDAAGNIGLDVNGIKAQSDGTKDRLLLNLTGVNDATSGSGGTSGGF